MFYQKSSTKIQMNQVSIHFPISQTRKPNVDNVLHCIYQRVHSLPLNKTSPRIIFTSFNPAICPSVYWKQPNCKYALYFSNILLIYFAAFFNTCCRINRREQKYKSIGYNPEIYLFLRLYSYSVRTSLNEAVKFAKPPQFALHYLRCYYSDKYEILLSWQCILIVQVPSLIFNVKESGLILVMFADLNPNSNIVFPQKKHSGRLKISDAHTHFLHSNKKLFSHCKIAGFQEIGYLSNIDLMRGLSKTRIRTSSLIRISTQCLKVRKQSSF